MPRIIEKTNFQVKSSNPAQLRRYRRFWHDLGTDYYATKRALELDPEATRVKVIIPTSLAAYKRYFDKQLENQKVTKQQVADLFDMLGYLRKRGALTEMHYAYPNTESFHARNSEIVKNVKDLFAYSVNCSSGTRNTIWHHR